MQASLDLLSAPAREALRIHPDQAYTRLTVNGPGDPQVKELLSPLTPQSVFAAPPRDSVAAACALSALWLWHDHLEASHTLSQGIHTASGSLWHAIMHRREGDFWNSKYWYAKSANHPILPSIAANTGALTNPYPADTQLLRLTHGGWNAEAFVDLVEAVHHDSAHPHHALCVSLQQLEWRMLFDHDTRAATG